jgi:hypothetical protein
MGSLTLHAGRCSAAVAIRSLSLFGGAVSAGSVALTTRVAAGTRTSVRGVRVNGRPVAGNPRSIRIGHWGFLTLQPPRAALAIRLVKPHAGFSGGTVIVVAFAARSAARPARTLTLQHAARSSVFGRHQRHPRPQAHRPLHVTPPLGAGDYVFPVAGSPSFGDSYGGFRADVAGNWHHGDDIFAPIGTPALAVADGTLNRVGWERIGGWRLWVRDRRGNEFYYAHLSGYAPDALRSKRVRAGQVLGFVGNTGDAFTTPPHLHFEIHPHQLLRLQYDGAVDPTSYLEQWRHVRDVDAPRPAVPELPAGDVGREARFVFRTLLAARGLVRRAPTSPPRVAVAGVDRPSRPAVAAAPRPAAKDAAPARIAVAPLAVVAALAACGLAAFFGRRRPRRT